MKERTVATRPSIPARRRHRTLLLCFLVLLGLLALSQPWASLSAEPAAGPPPAPAVKLASPVVYVVEKCPASFPKSSFTPGQVIFLTGSGFRPYEPIYWDIFGLTNSCDNNTRIAHSRMVADANGAFCIYSYTVAQDDCGFYRAVVNTLYTSYYEVVPAGPTATPTVSATPKATATSVFVPHLYTFNGYVLAQPRDLVGTPSPESGTPLRGVRIQLLFRNGSEWQLVGETDTTESGWFGMDYTTDAQNPRFRVVEVDPHGYESIGAGGPPLYGFPIDANTMELRIPYARNPGVMYFYDRISIPTETPTETSTVTGTPPTPTETLTPIPMEEIKTVVLQQNLNGYKGVEDTYISSWFLYANYSHYNMMSVRTGNKMSPLLRFDLSFIPSNSLVLSAVLSVHASTAGPHAMRMESYRVYRPWMINEVNWIEASKGYKWAEWGGSRPGGDRAEAPSAGQQLDKTGKWYDFDLGLMAQDWVSSTPSNQGVLLKGEGETAVQWNFYTSEFWQQEFRPKLTIVYAITGPTPTLTPTRRPTATPTDTATPTNTIPPPPRSDVN